MAKIRRLRQLEGEDRRLKQVAADLMPYGTMPQDISRQVW